MKAQDLRIKNYMLDRENRLCRVTEITLNDFKAPAFEGAITSLPNQPIPLTEEWFLKLGFEKWGRNDLPRTVSFNKEWVNIFPANSFSDFEGFGFMYYKKEVEKSTESARTVIKYVHQLQNLYFSLTGEELKLNK